MDKKDFKLSVYILTTIITCLVFSIVNKRMVGMGVAIISLFLLPILWYFLMEGLHE